MLVLNLLVTEINELVLSKTRKCNSIKQALRMTQTRWSVIVKFFYRLFKNFQISLNISVSRTFAASAAFRVYGRNG